MATITRRPPACSGNSCQVGGFLAYASRYGRALVDRALHLPEGWAVDRAQRAEAGVPEPVASLPNRSSAWPCSSGRTPRASHAPPAPPKRAWMTADNVDGADPPCGAGCRIMPAATSWR